MSLELVKRQKPYEIKEVNEKARRTVGCMSTDAPDRDREIVEQEPLQKCMPAFVEKNGILLLMHDMYAGGIGKVIDWSGTEHETLIVCEYSSGHEIVYRGCVYHTDNVWKQIVQRILRTHSFGFMATREDLGRGLYRLIPTEVLEATVATIPANAEATFEVSKALELIFGAPVAKTSESDTIDELAALELAAMCYRQEQEQRVKLLARSV